MPIRLVIFLSLYLQVAAISVTPHWDLPVGKSRSTSTLQAVVNPPLTRGSTIHDRVWKNLHDLEAEVVRFQYWAPYPRLGVAELEAPKGNPRCATASSGYWVNIFCGTSDGVIEEIQFASFGNPSGSCGDFKMGSCNAPQTMQIVKNACLGKNSCSLNASPATFGSTCSSASLSIQAKCSNAKNETSWDFTLMDSLMEDFMNAQNGRSVMINICTPPQWMFNTPSQIPYFSDPNQVDWGYSQMTELRDPTMTEISDYYARVLSWYSKGGFTDEYGKFHSSKYRYNFDYWEVLNEVDLSPTMMGQPEYYTRLYDAVVNKLHVIDFNLKFVGMAYASLTLHKLDSHWFKYFLNSSNHVTGTPIDMITFHYYYVPASRTDPTTFPEMFPEIDYVVPLVKQIIDWKNEIAPHVLTDMNELGSDLPGDPSSMVPFPEIYWNAGAAAFAYAFAKLGGVGVDVLGHSQMVGYPTQYPAVSLVNWTTGAPTAKFSVVGLLKNQISLGDIFVETEWADQHRVHAQAFVTKEGQKKFLIINKSYQIIPVDIVGASSMTITFIDPSTGFGPPVTEKASNPIVLLPFGVVIIQLS